MARLKTYPLISGVKGTDLLVCVETDDSDPNNIIYGDTKTISLSQLSNFVGNVEPTPPVVDTTPPVITLLGVSVVNLTQGDNYTDAGATALDDVDGDLTSSIVTANPVDTSTPGTYNITYNVSDSSGNAAAERVRTVIIAADDDAPVITLLGISPITVEYNSVYTDLSATAFDDVDGDVTNDIVTTNNVNTSIVGTYSVTYNVTDSSGNAADEVTRVVNVADTSTPVITLLGSNPVNLEVGENYVDAGATATDNHDGDLTSSIVSSGTVDNNVLGTYYISYDVSDINDNIAATVTRTINVVDTTAPVITLLGNSSITIAGDSNYTDPGATANDNYDGDITSSITTVNPVNTNIGGNYTVTYNVTDSSGNAASQVTRTVVVDKLQPLTNSNIHQAVEDLLAKNITGVDTFLYPYGRIEDWDVSQVTNMSELFQYKIAFNADISAWDVSGVTNMASMFTPCEDFNQNISGWDVSNVTNMNRMFWGCTRFNADIDSWDVSSVRYMQYMFVNTTLFNQDLNSWDVSSVETMYNMFSGAHNFNGDISSWDVSLVYDMSFMFSDCYAFNQDISNWNVSHTNTMFRMFKDARAFNKDLSSWDVSGVVQYTNFSLNANSWTLPKPIFQ